MTPFSSTFDVVETPAGRELRIAVTGLDGAAQPRHQPRHRVHAGGRELSIRRAPPAPREHLDEQLGRMIAESMRS
ncbi:MAG: hypothetical protein IPF92_17530 [Myxococcales bacterium]|nr:hypothetical protein [Myxococcales bacterium]